MVPVPKRYDARMVAWLSLGQLISWGSSFYLFALLMEPIERELGINRAQSSLAFSVALLCEGLMAYPVGRWIDRGHERVVMTGGSVLAAVCLGLHSMVTGLMGFYAVWVGLGVAMAAVLYNPAFAVVTRRFAHDFRRAIITLTFLGGLASTLFLPLTAWMIATQGWRHALLCLALLHLLVCAPLHMAVLRGAPGPLVPDDEKRIKGPQVDAATQALVGVKLMTLMRSAPFLLIGLFVMVMMAVMAALPPHMVSLLRENGLAETWVIAVPASIGLIQVVGRLLMYFFEHHFDLHLANRLIPGLIPLGLLALLVAPFSGAASVWMVSLFVLLYGLGNGMLTIVKGTAMAQYVSRAHVARLNGALGFPVAVARAVAPLMLGVLWSAQVGYTHGLWLLLVISVLGVGALVLAQRFALAR
jgi:MFS family permease